MRSPFDSDDSAWWAVHGSSSPFPTTTKVSLDPAETLALGEGSLNPEAPAGDALGAMNEPNDETPSPPTLRPAELGRGGLPLREFIEAT